MTGDRRTFAELAELAASGAPPFPPEVCAELEQIIQPAVKDYLELAQLAEHVQQAA
jgi:hypothetical protein